MKAKIDRPALLCMLIGHELTPEGDCRRPGCQTPTGVCSACGECQRGPVGRHTICLMYGEHARFIAPPVPSAT